MTIVAPHAPWYFCTRKPKYIQNMKLQRFIPIAVMAVLAVAGCNPTQKSKPASEVAGNYNGYATAEFQYSPVPVASDGQSVAVVMETDETVSVSYKSDTWGTFTITGVSVSSDNGTYTLSGKGKTVMGMSADSQKEYECNLNAVVSGQDDFVFTFDVPAVMGGLKITVKPGKVPAGLVVSGHTKESWTFTLWETVPERWKMPLLQSMPYRMTLL